MKENKDNYSKLQKLVTLGDSDKELKKFPVKEQQNFLQSLDSVMKGYRPALESKTLKGKEKGCIELKKNGKPAYRVVYATKGDTLYLVNAYKKTSDDTKSKHKKLNAARLKKIK